MKHAHLKKVLAALAAACLALSGCAPKRAENTVFMLDTLITQKAVGGDAEGAIAAANSAIAALESAISLYREGSYLAAVNASAGIAPVKIGDPDVLALLSRARRYGEQSGGRFDVTVAPLSLLWDISGGSTRIPSEGEIAAALSLVDYRDLVVDEEAGTAFLRRAGQKIDLGGIGKGTACDLLYAVYVDHGVTSGLASVGGSIVAVGGREDGQPFSIGIRDPDGSDTSYMGILQLRDGFVSVSGDFERFFIADGKRYHHIFDTATGYPAEGDFRLVAVVCDSGERADALSTALFLMSREELIDAIGSADYGVIAIDREGAVICSASLRAQFTIENPAYAFAGENP